VEGEGNEDRHGDDEGDAEQILVAEPGGGGVADRDGGPAGDEQRHAAGDAVHAERADEGGHVQAGEPLLLYAVAAVFIGGASLTGGQGTIKGTVIGALIIAVIQFGLVFINVAPYWQFIAVGAVIIVAVLIDQLRDQLQVGSPT
jgi:hypothetical protein